MALERKLPMILPVRPGFFVGGRKKTQALDIGHAAALLIEKALDMKSEGAVAQVDIQTYFDALPVYEILQWLIREGVDTALAAAIGRHQLLVKIIIRMGASSCAVPARSQGGLTGSQLA